MRKSNILPILFLLLVPACGKKARESSTSGDTATPVATDEQGLAAGQDASNIEGQEVTYQAGGLTMKGFLAYDKTRSGKRPGVLVVHEWWGHNDYARRRARMLAQLGYTALAVDMYGDGKRAEHPDDAGKFASEAMQSMDVAKARFLAAMDLLKAHETTDPTRIAAIGYCFGGAVVLNMARLGVDLRGVVSFHGSLATSTPAQPGTVKAKVLVCHGADDTFIPAEHVANFKKEMEAAGVDYQFESYPGAVHSFTSTEADALAKKFNLNIAYNADADKKSWQAMQDFFAKIFAP